MSYLPFVSKLYNEPRKVVGADPTVLAPYIEIVSGEQDLAFPLEKCVVRRDSECFIGTFSSTQNECIGSRRGVDLSKFVIEETDWDKNMVYVGFREGGGKLALIHCRLGKPCIRKYKGARCKVEIRVNDVVLKEGQERMLDDKDVINVNGIILKFFYVPKSDDEAKKRMIEVAVCTLPVFNTFEAILASCSKPIVVCQEIHCPQFIGDGKCLECCRFLHLQEIDAGENPYLEWRRNPILHELIRFLNQEFGRVWFEVDVAVKLEGEVETWVKCLPKINPEIWARLEKDILKMRKSYVADVCLRNFSYIFVIKYARNYLALMVDNLPDEVQSLFHKFLKSCFQFFKQFF